jgi:hypothetical protein
MICGGEHNPTHPVRGAEMRVLNEEVLGDGGRIVRHQREVQLATFCEVTWAPGETHELPSEWNSGIHQVQSGVVVGGAAPSLIRADGTSPPIDPELAETLHPAPPRGTRRRSAKVVGDDGPEAA